MVFFNVFLHLWERMTALTNSSRRGEGKGGHRRGRGRGGGGRVRELFSDSEEEKKR